MSANLAHAANAPPALRTALAAAIAKHLSAQEALSKLTSAASDAQEAAVSAFGGVDRAKDAVAKAGKVDADALAEAVLAGKPFAGLASAREARTAIADAEETLTQATRVRDALVTKTEEAKISLSYAASGARSAALALVHANSEANLAAFIAETGRLQHELQERHAAIAWLRQEHLVPYLDPTISRIVSFRLVTDPGTPPRLDPTSTAGKWEGMVATLTRDPKAPAVIA